MYFDGELNDLGQAQLDPRTVLALIEAEPLKTWRTGPQRQERSEAHRQTLSIVMRFAVNPCSYDYNQFPAWETYAEHLAPVIKQAADYYGYTDYDVCYAMFASLRPGGRIIPHYDNAPNFQFCHRLHVPIKTDEQAIFQICDKDFNLKEGRLYEVNNFLLHGVTNNNLTEDRIHLIFDLFSREAPVKEVAH